MPGDCSAASPRTLQTVQLSLDGVDTSLEVRDLGLKGLDLLADETTLVVTAKLEGVALGGCSPGLDGDDAADESRAVTLCRWVLMGCCCHGAASYVGGIEALVGGPTHRLGPLSSFLDERVSTDCPTPFVKARP